MKKLLLLMMLFLLPIVSCGTCDVSLKDKFNMANEFARTGSHESMPLFRTWCDTAIDKCKAAGIAVANKQDCKQYVMCSKSRKVVITAANAVHIGVKMGIFYIIIGDKQKADDMFDSVMRALGEMKAGLQAAGFLEPLGLQPKEVH